MDLSNDLKDNWDDVKFLLNYSISIINRQLELSQLISDHESRLNAVFLSEREESIRGTDSMARARAKSFVGIDHVRYEYEFQALSNLLSIITSRISQLSPVQSQAQ